LTDIFAKPPIRVDGFQVDEDNFLADKNTSFKEI